MCFMHVGLALKVDFNNVFVKADMLCTSSWAVTAGGEKQLHRPSVLAQRSSSQCSNDMLQQE